MSGVDFDFETLLRYGIPGAILLTPLLLALSAGNTLVGIGSITFLIIFITVPVGYVVYQAWILIFELFGLGYRRGRANLKYILHEVGAKNVDKDEIYLAWEYWIYLKSNELGGVFTRARRLWHLYHSDMTDTLSLALGSLAAYILRTTNPAMRYVVTAYPLLLLLFLLKSRSLRKELDLWELYIARQNIGEIKQIFHKIGK